MILISIWDLLSGLGSLMQRRHSSIHLSLYHVAQREFSVKGWEVMIPWCLAENVTTFLASCTRYSAAGTATLRLHVAAGSRTLILPDPNCRPGYVFPLSRRRQRQSSRLQESVLFGDPARESTKFRVQTYRESCSENTTAQQMHTEGKAFNIYRSFL